jgi:hypothetical protein
MPTANFGLGFWNLELGIWNLEPGMWLKKKHIFAIVLLSMSYLLPAQEDIAKNDSIKLYSNIETYSERSGFTRFMYRLFFEPVAKGSQKSNLPVRVEQMPYSSFEGKTIRKIHIVTLDPFGNSIGDTIVASESFISKTGNKLHIKTHQRVIRNLLLIAENQVFDSLLVKESERLVRRNTYVSDVSFYVISNSENLNSVDIHIRVLDTWSIIPDGSYAAGRVTVGLTEDNFIGFGHKFQNRYIWNTSNNAYAHNHGYYIPNIRNTYIRSALTYRVEENKDYDISLKIDRPFFSSFARWGAGVYLSQQYHKDFYKANDTLIGLQTVRFNNMDYWVGKATPIFRGRKEIDRTTNFITTIRYLRVRFLEKPISEKNAEPVFANEELFLAGVSLSARRYVQDKYIFNFGLTEDVPVGRIISLTGGFQVRNNQKRPYLGARFSLGNYYSIGYLSLNLEYGTFYHASNFEQGALTARVSYFTNLIEAGRWRFRHFIKPQLTLGVNRFTNDGLTLNDGYGLTGFNSKGFSGTKRLLLALQTQSYAPWDLVGFRFGPFLSLSLGMLGDDAKAFKNSKVYSQIGVGVLIKNVHLVINTFHVSLAFYPSIPGIGHDILRINSFRTTDFGFIDFVTGKPEVVMFQ